MSALAIADWLVSVDVVAPVVLVDSLVAPIVLEGDVLGVVVVVVELLGYVGSVVAAREGSVALLVVLVGSGVEVAVLGLGYVELGLVTSDG